MNMVKLIGLGLAALAIFGAGWQTRGWLADKDMAEAVAAAERQASEAWAAESKANVKGLKEREQTIKDLTEANRNLSGKLKEAYAANPETRGLAEMCLPDSVIECFLN